MPPPKLNERAKAIIELCADAREKYQPDGDVTYCNLAVRYVAHSFAEYTEFSKMLANKMIQHMEEKPEWAEVEPGDAKKLADDGKLVIAGRRNNPNGHVAVVMPGRALISSGKWPGKKWPIVSNVGRENWICGANYAFARPPKFYVLIEG